MWKLMKQRTKEYYKKRYAYKYDNLAETDNFLKRHKLSNPIQRTIASLPLYLLNK